MLSFYFLFLLTLERVWKEVGKRERERNICFSTYLCSPRFLLVCALTRDWTCNLGASGQHSNQLSYLARVHYSFFKKDFYLFIFRERRRERERKGEKHQCAREASIGASHTPLSRGPACNQACALTGIEPAAPQSAGPHQLSHTCQGTLFYLWNEDLFMALFKHSKTDFRQGTRDRCRDHHRGLGQWGRETQLWMTGKSGHQQPGLRVGWSVNGNCYEEASGREGSG